LSLRQFDCTTYCTTYCKLGQPWWSESPWSWEVLLNRQTYSEYIPLLIMKGGKPLGQAAGAGKKIDHRDSIMKMVFHIFLLTTEYTENTENFTFMSHLPDHPRIALIFVALRRMFAYFACTGQHPAFVEAQEIIEFSLPVLLAGGENQLPDIGQQRLHCF